MQGLEAEAESAEVSFFFDRIGHVPAMAFIKRYAGDIDIIMAVMCRVMDYLH